jgi:hypothetical protein
MIKIDRAHRRSGESDLQRVIEPLASFICATERPGSALISALTILITEVEQTNKAAHNHFAAVSGTHCR